MTARQATRGADPQRSLHGGGVVGAREHELPDRQAAVWLQVVEAVMQTQRTGLLVQQPARALPAQRRGAWHFRQELVVQCLQVSDPAAHGHACVVGEGDVYSTGGER